jgi:DNA-binding transcriptional regulator YhcF (GntR family)
MSIQSNLQTPKSGLERVRHELLTALHFGKLKPGERAPSVRRLADLTGMNRKTVHRAYRRLAREGLLDLRPGSGTYIAEAAPINDLLGAVERCRTTARDLGLEPLLFSSFLEIFLGGGPRDLPLAVVDGSLEQVSLMTASLRAELRVAPRPVLLSRLARDPVDCLEGCCGAVTTDAHHVEVLGHVEAFSLPVFRVALDRSFPRRLVEEACHGDVLVVVRDLGFETALRRALREVRADSGILERFHVLEPGDARRVLGRATAPLAVYVSPLVPEEALGPLPRVSRRIRGHWRLEGNSVERLKASLSLELASRQHADSRVSA